MLESFVKLRRDLEYDPPPHHTDSESDRILILTDCVSLHDIVYRSQPAAVQPRTDGRTNGRELGVDSGRLTSPNELVFCRCTILYPPDIPTKGEFSYPPVG